MGTTCVASSLFALDSLHLAPSLLLRLFPQLSLLSTTLDILNSSPMILPRSSSWLGAAVFLSGMARSSMMPIVLNPAKVNFATILRSSYKLDTLIILLSMSRSKASMVALEIVSQSSVIISRSYAWSGLLLVMFGSAAPENTLPLRPASRVDVLLSIYQLPRLDLLLLISNDTNPGISIFLRSFSYFDSSPPVCRMSHVESSAMVLDSFHLGSTAFLQCVGLLGFLFLTVDLFHPGSALSVRSAV